MKLHAIRLDRDQKIPFAVPEGETAQWPLENQPRLGHIGARDGCL